jgi:hypothetical protein
MGMSISWLAVRAPEQVVLRALGLVTTGGRDELPAESPIAGAQLPDDWYLVVLDRYEHPLVRDDVLRRVSELGELVAAGAEEHVMCSVASGWREGERVWRARHDPQAGIDHLELEGEPPAGFDAIRSDLLQQQHDAGGRDAEVDYVFEIPLETARRVSGFSYQDAEPDGGFVVLRPASLR